MAEIDHHMELRARADLGNPGKIPDDMEDFGLYYPLWYVYDTWVEHNEHGLYPEVGGYADQCWQLMQDWKVLDLRYHRAVRELRANGAQDNDLMDTLSHYNRKPEVDMRRLIE